jgi:catechol 2,3-dioxygenase-like lactoylglutathione lyase family enzyme
MDNPSAPNIKLAVPFFGVANMEAALRFYIDGLGFKMTKQWTPRGKIEWCWLERDKVSIMLQEPHAPHTQDDLPKSGPNICFQCEDAIALYKEFHERGLQVTEPFVGNSMWVIGLKDPDGYRIEFESFTDVAEETSYSEWLAGLPQGGCP